MLKSTVLTLEDLSMKKLLSLFLPCLVLICLFSMPAEASGPMRWATSTVASGQTTKVVKLQGILASASCVAQLNTVATNSVSIRSVVPAAGQATVTLSGDPGAGGAKFTVICRNTGLPAQ